MPTRLVDEEWSDTAALELLLQVDRSRYARHGRARPHDFVIAVIEFANEKNSERLFQKYVALSGNVESIRLVPRRGPGTAPTPRSLATEEQEFVETSLMTILNGTAKDRLELARELADEADRVVLFPSTAVVPSGKGATITTTYTYETDSSTSVLSRGLIHLLDTSETYLTNLRRCKLRTCGRWFLRAKEERKRHMPGIARHAYCTEEHANDATRDRKRDEAVKRRARKKAEAASKARTRRTSK